MTAAYFISASEFMSLNVRQCSIYDREIKTESELRKRIFGPMIRIRRSKIQQESYVLSKVYFTLEILWNSLTEKACVNRIIHHYFVSPSLFRTQKVRIDFLIIQFLAQYRNQ